MILLELASVDTEFANAVKMLVIKAQNDGLAKLPMQNLIQSLNKMGFSATGQVDAIRGLIATFKAKNNDLVADVNNKEVIITTMPDADTADQAEENKVKVNKSATKQARKELGL